MKKNNLFFTSLLFFSGCASQNPSRLPASVGDAPRGNHLSDQSSASPLEDRAAPKMTLEQYAAQMLEAVRCLDRVNKLVLNDYGSGRAAREAIADRVQENGTKAQDNADTNAEADLVAEKHPSLREDIKKMKETFDSKTFSLSSTDPSPAFEALPDAKELNPKTLDEAISLHREAINTRIEEIKKMKKPLDSKQEKTLMLDWLVPKFTEEMFRVACVNQGIDANKDAHKADLEEMYKDRQRLIKVTAKALGIETMDGKFELPSEH